MSDERLCEYCQRRPAIGRVVLPGDEVALCGACLDDARALGLVGAGASC